ncbi:hypothetical protein [Dyella ginsengisoli]|uniref:hypothetical protein n=1 Tax=Dyella ginsengisoli TaxID=363848 RepID=UPI00036EC352|nr:hypothetical protein [Dyella ginsengisoli]
MSGLNISCGDFLADDKSGSAFERVLIDLPRIDGAIKHQILSSFDSAEYTVIEATLAKDLVSSIRAYRDQLVLEIGHDDYLKEMEREEQTGADPIKLKWGEGRGWRLYCSNNLLAACEQSAATQEPVVVCLG